MNAGEDVATGFRNEKSLVLPITTWSAGLNYPTMLAE